MGIEEIGPQAVSYTHRMSPKVTSRLHSLDIFMPFPPCNPMACLDLHHLECSWTPCGFPHPSTSSSIKALETRDPTGLFKPKSGVLMADAQAPLVPGSELWEFMSNEDSWAHPELQARLSQGGARAPASGEFSE